MNFKDILNIIIKNKESLFAVVVGVALLSSIYVFFIATPYYIATASIIQKKEQSMMDANVANFSAIAKNFGLGGIDSKINFYIPDIVNSDMMLQKIIDSNFMSSDSKDKIKLIDYWELDDIEDTHEQIFQAKEKLRNLININESIISGLITISIETENPQLSSSIIQFITSEVDDYISTETSKHFASKKNQIEKLKNNYSDRLKKAENKLEEFQLNNFNLIDDPTIQLKRERLLRAVEINKELFIFLNLEYEQAKIQEFDNTEKIHVLDNGQPNYHKTSPKRLLLILLSIISSLFGYTYYLILKTKFE
ncbi:MAG: hypothetical protein CMG25_05320 [Candidatus Marinimicrobia bacterium]|nr:hypothetical protein [Candidatus Neomarinimicrobiota bacterium]|tara:strand:+ start:6354 stop:7277 length:924 start_codon:yes stop_codon:yes gene_type:complete